MGAVLGDTVVAQRRLSVSVPGVLTSLDAGDLHDTGVGGEPVEQVTRLAHGYGLDGVVCSPTDLEALAGGAHYLVIGRPITQAADPVAALAGNRGTNIRAIAGAA